MSPNDGPENAMKTRHQMLVAAVDRAINEADPIGLLEIGAPADEYAPEVGTIVPRLASVERPEDVAPLLHEEFIRWFGDPIGACLIHHCLFSHEPGRAAVFAPRRQS